MKTYSMSFGAAMDHKPEHPERTARKSGTGMNFDITFQVWPNRVSMAKSIRMQERREHRTGDWKAVVALTAGEGY
jgi:hypothetical protein